MQRNKVHAGDDLANMMSFVLLGITKRRGEYVGTGKYGMPNIANTANSGLPRSRAVPYRHYFLLGKKKGGNGSLIWVEMKKKKLVENKK